MITKTKGGARGRSSMDVLGAIKVPGRQTAMIALNNIRPDPQQPRSAFRPVDGVVAEKTLAALRDLAANIRDLGLKQPITVRPDHDKGPGYYIIVAGERRWRAKCMLRDEGVPGHEEIEVLEEAGESLPVVRLEQLAENIQREDLTDLEIAAFLQSLMEDYKELRQTDLCTLLHKPKSWISRMLAMLKPEYRDLIDGGYITYAAILEQFRALPEHRQNALAAEAASVGRKITSGDIRRHKGAGGEEAAGRGKSGAQDLRDAVARQFPAGGNSAQAGEALGVAMMRQEVRIKSGQAGALLSALKGVEFPVVATLTTTDIRTAITKLGGSVPENDLLLANTLYDCLGLKS